MAKMKTKRNFARGTVLVEMALVIVLLMTLTLGAIYYGWLFVKMGQIGNAARNGARVAVRADGTKAIATGVINAMMTNAGLPKYTVEFIPTEPRDAKPPDQVTVKLTIETKNIPLLGGTLVPMPSQLTSSCTMIKEGP